MTYRALHSGILFAGLALAVAACSGSDDIDAGVIDAGFADSGVEVDAGPPDSGLPAECNPVDGSGCATDRYCVLQLSGSQDGKGQCRELINPVAHEAECSQSLQNCEAGFACTFFQGDDNPTCRKVCNLQDGTGCEGLTGSAISYACNLRPGQFARYGFCSSPL